MELVLPLNSTSWCSDERWSELQLRFPGIKSNFLPSKYNPILKIVLSLKFIAGCDRGVRGFPKASLRLQYGPCGCGIGLLVVMGTSRGSRGGGLGVRGGPIDPKALFSLSQANFEIKGTVSVDPADARGYLGNVVHCSSMA